ENVRIYFLLDPGNKKLPRNGIVAAFILFPVHSVSAKFASSYPFSPRKQNLKRQRRMSCGGGTHVVKF
ncbi:MAG: hypothetical protein IKZ66_06430, partial [Schwartzia sp.]|nr:hypothetical protein [Schwartzia sp. (in: firmicutes)]